FTLSLYIEPVEMCRNVVLRVTELVEVLFYTGRGFIPSLKARVFTPTSVIKSALSFFCQRNAERRYVELISPFTFYLV
ncbi:hypothetical protein, partial [Microcystis wesenbergii]|uniref:hypothetical protein n=1 Tax=Microcystis wesenbergii TaxID=44823 RepID=UPI001A7E8A54